MQVFTSGNFGYGFNYYSNPVENPYQETYDQQVAERRLSELQEAVKDAKKSSNSQKEDDSTAIFADSGLPSAAGSYRDPSSIQVDSYI